MLRIVYVVAGDVQPLLSAELSVLGCRERAAGVVEGMAQG